jgi:hypothetical protein
VAAPGLRGAFARARAHPPRFVAAAGAGALVGVVTYVVLQLLPDAAGALGLSASLNSEGRDDVLTAITFGGTTVGTYAAKSTFDTWVGKLFGSSGPANIFKAQKVIHIAQAETEEEAARRAMDVYKDLIMIKGAPEGSTGGDLSDAIDAFTEFATGGADVDGPDDDDL